LVEIDHARSEEVPPLHRQQQGSRRGHEHHRFCGILAFPALANRFGLVRGVLSATLLFAVAACSAPPMRWQKPGTGDAAQDEAACRADAHREAIRRMPYGNGPPIYGVYREMSMLQWTQGIDIQRYYLGEHLTKACMYDKGFELMPMQRG
jgi:hypothetical protein